MRLLYPRLPPRRAAAPRAHAGADSRRDQGGIERESLPVHWIPEDLRGRRAGRGSHARGGSGRVSSGERRVVGTPRPKVDATAKVTGALRFADDLALPRMLHCKLLRSRHPHARIVRIDTSRALSADGVIAVLTGRDLPIPFGI